MDVTKTFEDSREHLRQVAYRMLGSLSEADDAVQEAWLKLSRADTSGVENLRGWLTTVVARVCLDMLRSRKSRREEPIGPEVPEKVTAGAEHEAAMAESIGLAVLVVLDRLDPAERLAFVLHDMFAVPFDEIAGIVGRSPAAARQLASRARRRVRGEPPVGEADLARHRDVIGAFLAALRAGDVEGLVAVLDPDVVVRAQGVPDVRGARAWAKGAAEAGRMATGVQLALIEGAVGLVFAPKGQALRAVRFLVEDDRVVDVEVILDPALLQQLEIHVMA